MIELRGGHWVLEKGIQVWREYRNDDPQCGIEDCTAEHVPWTGLEPRKP